MKERMNMLRMTKRKSRILAGFMAFVLVFSNIAANVQTVYAFGPAFHLGDNGEWESAGGSESDNSGDLGAGVAEEEKDYDFWVDIWPKMAVPEDAEEEDAAEEWTGEWEQYEYVNSGMSGDESWTLGQALLLSDKYKEQYGDLDPDLPGTWAGDNDDVMEVRPDGTAFVKEPGYVNVTFIYEKPETTAVEAEVSEENNVVIEAAVPETAEEEADSAEEEAAPEIVEEASDGAEEEVAAEIVEEASDGAEEEAASEIVEVAADGVEGEAAPEMVEVVSDGVEAEAAAEIVEEAADGVEEEAASEIVEEAADDAEEEAAPEAAEEAADDAEEKMVPSEKNVTDEANIPSGDIAENETADSEEKQQIPTATSSNADKGSSDEIITGDDSAADDAADDAAADDAADGAADESDPAEDTETPADECPLEDGTVLEWVVKVETTDLALMDNASMGLKVAVFPGVHDGATATGDHPTYEGNAAEEGAKYGRLANAYYLPGKLNGAEALWKQEVSSTSKTIYPGPKGVITDHTYKTYNPVHYNAATGEAVYCIEPGVDISDEETAYESETDPATQIEYFSNYESYSGLTGDDLSKMIARVLTYGYQGYVIQNGYKYLMKLRNRSNPDADKNYGQAVATQILVWETVIGERDANFNRVTIPDRTYDYGSSGTHTPMHIYDANVRDVNPLRTEIKNAYDEIVRNVQDSIRLSIHPELDVENNENVAPRWKKDSKGYKLEITDSKNKLIQYKDNITITRLDTNKTLDEGPDYTISPDGSRLTITLDTPAELEISIEWSDVRAITVYSAAPEAGEVDDFFGPTSRKQDVAQLNAAEQYKDVYRLTYSATEVGYAPKVEKVISGATVPNNETFTFTLAKAKSDDGTAYTGVTMPASLSVSRTGAGEASFGEIKFSRPGTYFFEITEDKPNPVPAGYSYDESTWNLTVEVELNGGVLSATGTYTKDGTVDYEKATFTNTYTLTPTDYAPSVTKTVIGNPPSDETFTFNLTANSGNPAGATLQTPVQVNISGSGSGTFGNIQFTKAGTYNFTISEAAGSKAGYSYDNSEWTLTVVVVDNNSHLTVTSHTYAKEGSSNNDAASFTNNYTVTEAAYAPQVKKLITGDTPSNKTFTFNLSAKTGNPEGALLPSNRTATVTGANTTAFENITFTKAGTYKFEIKETKGSEPGYTYDESVWELQVVVADKGGRLEVESHTYSKGGANGSSSSDYATFTNTYQPADASSIPKVKKEINNQSGESIPGDNRKSFTFTIAASDTYPADAVTMNTSNVTFTLPDDLNEEAKQFGTITYHKAGTYSFLINETGDSGNGYTVNNTPWTYTVTVTDNNGQLDVTGETYYLGGVEQSDATFATFTNTYKAAEATSTPQVMKQIAYPAGGAIPEGNTKTFTFNIVRTDTNAADAVTMGNTSVDVTLPSDLDQVIEFGNITYKKEGTYTFEITESGEDGNGYTVNNTPWIYTVEVSDENGQLVATGTYSKDGAAQSGVAYATFTNTYKPTQITYAPKVQKTVEAENGDLVNTPPETFTFQIADAADNTGATLPDTRQVELTLPIVNADGTVMNNATGNFGQITFTKAGTYTYNITEVKGDTPGYTYDQRTWTLTVTVTDNLGVLEVSSSYVSNSETGTAASFTNTYKVENVNAVPSVKKAFTSDSADRPNDKAFAFTLTPDENNPADGATMTNDTVSVTGEGSASFGTVTFNKVGTYNFTIRETAGDDAGYGYDAQYWVWTVVVTDEDKDSKLEAVNTYTHYDESGEVITPETADAATTATFTNTYRVASTEGAPKVIKEFTEESSNRPVDAAKQFTFTLAPNGFDAGTGVNPTDGAEFSKDSEGNVLNTITISEGEEATSFSNIEFKKAGTYTFTITENDFDYPKYTKDSSIWTWEVVVEDNNSILRITSETYLKDGVEQSEGVANATFENTYKVEPIEYTPVVAKTITGDERRGAQQTFTFTITPDAATQTAIANGDVAMSEPAVVQIEDAKSANFGTIKFNEAGAYTFTIVETKPDPAPAGYTYDEGKWTLVVTVTDKDGVLSQSHAYTYDGTRGTEEEKSSGEQATFINNYKVTPTDYQPKVVKSFQGDELPTGNQYGRTRTFTFSLAEPAGADGGDGHQDGVTMPAETVVSVTNGFVDGDRVKSFAPITFTKAGTYHFTVSENDITDAPGYTKDDTVWTIDVKVEDIESQLTVTEVTYSNSNGINKPGVGEEAIKALSADFTNTYTVTPTQYTPMARKEVTGKARPSQKQFRFELRDDEGNPENGVERRLLDANGNPSDEVYELNNGVDSIHVNGVDDGEYSLGIFHTITFKKAGTYKFHITEANTGVAGYTYDPGSWTLTVVVVDNDSKLEVASHTYTKDERQAGDALMRLEDALFVNDYQVTETTYAPRVYKVVQGDRTPVDKQFTFRLTEAETYSADDVVMPDPAEVTVTGAAFGTFDEITFKTAGTYKFMITEEAGEEPGYSYDNTLWQLTVVVKDNESILYVDEFSYEQIRDEAHPGNAYTQNNVATFVNEYAPAPTALVLPVTKYVTGSVRPENNNAAFTFALSWIASSGLNNGAVLPENTSITIQGEVPGTDEELGSASFGAVRFVHAGVYSFVISEVTGTDSRLPGYTYDNSNWNVIVNVVDNNGALDIEGVAFEHPVVDGETGERRTEKYEGKLTDVTDTAENAVKTYEAAPQEGSNISFTNDYDVESTKYAPKVSKEFALGADVRPTEETFTFDLEAAEDYGSNITFSEASTAKEVTVTGAGITSFDNITFNEAGTYEFIIGEVQGDKPGYTYDGTEWKLTVEVVDSGEQAEGVNRSQLKINTVSYVQIDTDEPKTSGEMATFTNDYKIEDTSYVPSVSKALTGEERPSEKTFTFSIAASSYTPPAYAPALASGVVMPEKTTTAVTGEGTASFDEIGFTEPGTYKFVITEMDGGENGYTYDTAVWNLTVEVQDINSQLTVTGKTFEKDDNATVSTERASFVNDYQVKSTVYAPEVVKTITGTPLWDETFEFELTASADNKEGGAEFSGAESARKVTVTGAGTAKFDDITFKKAGTYTFTVKETAGNSPYWTYDDRSWTLTVVVKDEDSQLVVKSHSYVSNRPTPDTSETAAEFENGFTTPGDLRISKTVTGNAGEVRRDFHFTVTLTDLSGNPLKGSYSYTGSSIYGSEDAPADGVITDGVVTVTLRHGQEITFHYIPAGTSYRVEEAEADADGYRTTLTVDGNGQAVAAAEGTIQIDGTAVVEYENYRYQPTGGTTPDRPGTNIPDNEVPQSPGTPDIITISDEPTPLSDFETIEDEDVPLAFLAPMTGDNRPVGAAALFGLLALGMMGAFGILASKKDEEDA